MPLDNGDRDRRRVPGARRSRDRPVASSVVVVSRPSLPSPSSSYRTEAALPTGRQAPSPPACPPVGGTTRCHHVFMTWTDVVGAVGAAATPVVVAVLAFVFTRSQARSEELLKVRLEYYKLLAPDLNMLMCYVTFIGSWRDISPPEILELKRRLDKTFYCAAPLFSNGVLNAYDELMDRTFTTFGAWGQDAKIVSNPYRRRQSWRGAEAWSMSWNTMFTLSEEDTIPADTLKGYRDAYDRLITTLVKDLTITRARSRYTTDRVSLNAHAPKQRDVVGSGNQTKART